MNKTFCILLLFTSFFCFSQVNKLQGSWILEKIIYKEGRSLEINHPMYSTFLEYNFNGSNLKINNYKTFTSEIDLEKIDTKVQKIRYKFIGEYLVTYEEGDNKQFYFLPKEDFIKKYPEFLPDEILVDNQKVYKSNLIIKPEFNYYISFDDYLRKNIPSYDKTQQKNTSFKAQFIITKDNKIVNIKIINSISEKFDSEFIKALENSEKFWNNNSKTNLLVEQQFYFYKLFDSLINVEEKKILNILKKGNDYYDKNDFTKSITAYSEISKLDIPQFSKQRFETVINEIYIHLGISYLVNQKQNDACNSFRAVGGKTNFNVRNYLINFCQ